jgi:hypothetical protein
MAGPVEKELMDVQKYILHYFGGDLQKIVENTKRDLQIYRRYLECWKTTVYNVSSTIAHMWTDDLPDRFFEFEDKCWSVPPIIRDISDMYCPTGEAIVGTKGQTLEYLEKASGGVESGLDGYIVIVDNIRDISSINPIFAEALAKKTLRLIEELQGDADRYTEVCESFGAPLKEKKYDWRHLGKYF